MIMRSKNLQIVECFEISKISRDGNNQPKGRQVSAKKVIQKSQLLLLICPKCFFEMSKYSAYKNKFFILFKHSYETYSPIISEGLAGGYEQFNPLHIKAFGVHGSPIQFFTTPKLSWIAIIALAALQEQGRWLIKRIDKQASF